MRTRHWGTWFFGCIMGLLPLSAWLFAHSLIGGRWLAAPSATRELLFFALSTFSTGLINLSEEPHRGRSCLWVVGLVLTIFSAVFYGVFLTGEALHAAVHVRFAYSCSVILAGVALFYGAIERITHRRSSR